MRKYFSQEERAEYRAQADVKMKEAIQTIASTWQSDPRQIAEYLAFKSQFHNYSARNSLLIYQQNPHASFVASFKRFKDLGYPVRKGEHGMMVSIYAPTTYFRTKEDSPWRTLGSATPEEKQMIRAGMLESWERPGYKIGTVFDISQTTCPREDYPKLLGLGYDNAQHAEIYASVKKYFATIQMPVKEVDLQSVTLRGSYYHDTHEIRINELLGDTQKLSTLLHEGAHGMFQHENAETKSTAQKEFEADSLSIMFSNAFDIPVPDARCAHLAVSFQQYTAEQTAAGKPVEIDELLNKATELFNQHISKMYEQLTRDGILPQRDLAPVQSAPHLEQEKHGHWIRHNDEWFDYVECSECGAKQQSESDSCNNCSAVMTDEPTFAEQDDFLRETFEIHMS